MNNLQTAVFGGGCFWCIEPLFQKLRGVQSVVSGYAGGVIENPTYEQVSSGRSDHAEVIKIQFNPDDISYENLLEIFFAIHDPTTLNRQGNDVGTQYRSVIFYTDGDQQRLAEQSIQILQEKDEFESPIVTEVKPLDKFYPAEDYHQNYYSQNQNQPYCQLVIAPKIKKFLAKFSDQLKVEKS